LNQSLLATAWYLNIFNNYLLHKNNNAKGVIV